jgi:hypothetical protein
MDGGPDDSDRLKVNVGDDTHLACPFARCQVLRMKHDRVPKMRDHLNAEHRDELATTNAVVFNGLMSPRGLVVCDRCRVVSCADEARLHVCPDIESPALAARSGPAGRAAGVPRKEDANATTCSVLELWRPDCNDARPADGV